jgi:hypothetical protein
MYIYTYTVVDTHAPDQLSSYTVFGVVLAEYDFVGCSAVKAYI